MCDLVHLCCWDGRRCYALHCDTFQCATGEVELCVFHGHASGRDTPRKSVGRCLSLLDIWALAKRRR